MIEKNQFAVLVEEELDSKGGLAKNVINMQRRMFKPPTGAECDQLDYVTNKHHHDTQVAGFGEGAHGIKNNDTVEA